MEDRNENDYIFILLSNPEGRAYLVASSNQKVFDNKNLALFTNTNLVERMRVTSKSQIKIEVLEIVKDLTRKEASLRRKTWYRQLEKDYDFFNIDYRK